MKSKLAFLSFLFLCAVSFLTAARLLYDFSLYRKKTFQSAMEEARSEADKARKLINDELAKIEPIARSLADGLNSGELTHDGLTERLKGIIEKSGAGLYGIGVAFAPDRDDRRFRENSPYYVRRQGGRRDEDIVQVFTASVSHVDEKSHNKITTGVVFADYSIEQIREKMSALELGKTGYWFLLSKDGSFIHHPVNDYAKKGKGIFDVARELDDERLRVIGEKATSGESGVADYKNELTGQSSWIFYEPIPSTGWSLCLSFIKDEMLTDAETVKRRKILIALTAMAFLTLLAAIGFRAHRGETGSLWRVSLLFSVLLLFGIGYIWHLVLTTPSGEAGGLVKVVDRAGLDNLLDSNNRASLRLKKGKPVHIPTGIYINSLKHSGNGEASLSGYVWQKYPDGLPAEASRGFVLPDATSLSVQEAYRRKENGAELIGWSFQCSLPQSIDVSKYPFDRGALSLHLSHRDIDKNVVLVPDLKAYKIVSPTSTPGLNKDLDISGWSMEKSFFGYRTGAMHANFGIEGFVREDGFPELYYTVLIRRNVLGPFITHLLPIIVASFILFAVMMIVTRHHEKSGKFGFTTLSTVGACSGLFFGILFAHARLRQEFHAEGITYLEHFHFVIYVAILLVALNSFLFNSLTKNRFISYHDNLLPKLFYWPVTLGAILVITIRTFY